MIYLHTALGSTGGNLTIGDFYMDSSGIVALMEGSAIALGQVTMQQPITNLRSIPDITFGNILVCIRYYIVS